MHRNYMNVWLAVLVYCTYVAGADLGGCGCRKQTFAYGLTDKNKYELDSVYDAKSETSIGKIRTNTYCWIFFTTP
jgi:hypothetical protein